MDNLADSRPEWEISLGVDLETGSDEESETSELQSLLKDIRHITTSLYNTSTAIRNPVPRERLAKFTAIDVSHFTPLDIEHIRHKFPGAPEYLIKRLGEANCKRRQLLQYYKNQYDRIARYTNLPLSASDTGDKGKAVTSTKSPATVPTVLQSQIAVTTRPGAIPLDEVESDEDYLSQTSSDEDHLSQTPSDGDHSSQTSYANSINQHIDTQIPPPPNATATFDGEPFQCPYCYQIIKIGNLRSWR